MAKVATKTYTYADGSTGRSAKVDAKSLAFKFGEGDDEYTISVELAKLGKDVQVCAAWHGVAQKIGDAYAGVKGDVEKAIENAESMLESLAANSWVTEGEGAGPRITVLLEAIARAKKAAGKPFDGEKTAAKCADKAYREAALKVPEVNAEYKAIQAERAAARAKEARAEAKAGTGEGLAAL